MEDELTLEELYLLMETEQDREYRRNKFAAALQGVDLDENKKNSDFEQVKQRAAAALAGKSESEYVFDMIGIEVEDDD